MKRRVYSSLYVCSQLGSRRRRRRRQNRATAAPTIVHDGALILKVIK